MKKVFKLENLDCAHCAQKMEDGINKIDGVIGAKVNFLLLKLTIEADEKDMDRVVAEAIRVCNKIEPDCKVVR